MLPKVVCIVGPTSSGKTALGLTLAELFHGEIINADARQGYKHFTIGTGKPRNGISGVYRHKRVYMVEGVPHHLMDFLAPTKLMTVADWRKRAITVLKEIVKRKHVPIIVGGTGLYTQALVDSYQLPAVPPQVGFRLAMESKTLPQLVEQLTRLDSTAAKTVDLKNRRRVLRALEVVVYTGKPFADQKQKAKPVVEPFFIGISRPREELYRLINEAVDRRIEQGWVEEVRSLIKKGIPFDAPAMTSIGYREIAQYVQGKMTLEETISRVKQATRQYAKRQMTWFKRDQRIHWISDKEDAVKMVREFLK